MRCLFSRMSLFLLNLPLNACSGHVVATGHKRVTFLAIVESSVELFYLFFMWDLKFLQRWQWGLLSPGMLKCVVSFKFSNLWRCRFPEGGFLVIINASCRGGVILNLQQCLMEQMYESRTINQYVAISEGYFSKNRSSWRKSGPVPICSP